MTLYHVVALIEHLYEVEADSPEYAARVVEEGDGGRNTQIDGWIDRVVPPRPDGQHDPLAKDLRKPQEV